MTPSKESTPCRELCHEFRNLRERLSHYLRPSIFYSRCLLSCPKPLTLHASQSPQRVGNLNTKFKKLDWFWPLGSRCCWCLAVHFSIPFRHPNFEVINGLMLPACLFLRFYTIGCSHWSRVYSHLKTTMFIHIRPSDVKHQEMRAWLKSTQLP